MAVLKCAISGGSGYVGSCISSHLKAKGCSVVNLGRREGDIPFSLESGVSPGSLKGFDALIHCAYDFKPKRWEDIRRVNAEGSKALLRSAKANGVKEIIFISTMSAFPGCRSYYGRAKLEIEEEARKTGAFIIRPGLIYGKDKGSVMGKMQALVLKFPVLPDIRTGKNRLYLCHGQDLGSLVHRIVAEEGLSPGVPITAAHDKGFTLREILSIMAKSSGKKVAFLPFPKFMLIFGLKAAETIGLSQGIRSDSMTGLLNLDPSPDFSETKKSGVAFREFSVESLAQ